MRRGGVVGFQEGGYTGDGYGDELTYGNQDDPGFLGGAFDYAKEHPFKSAAQGASVVALTKMFGPEMARKALQLKNIPSAWNNARGAAGTATEGFGSLLRSGAGTSKYNPARWASNALTRAWSSTPSKSTAWTNTSDANRALGRRGLGRGVLGGLASLGLTLPFWGGDDEDEVIPPVAEETFGRRAIRPGGGAGRSPSQDLYAQIEELQTAASVPSEAEKNRYKLDADRAKGLRDRRSGIEALMPTEKQYGHRQKSVGFDALAGFLSRTGSPNDMPVGQMGERIRAESSRQLAEKLGFEDSLAGIDTDIYGVEGGSLDQQIARQRAGDPYDQFMINAKQRELDNAASLKQATTVANIQVGARRDEQIGRLYEALMEPMSDEQRQLILEQIQRLGGGGGYGAAVASQVADHTN